MGLKQTLIQLPASSVTLSKQLDLSDPLFPAEQKGVQAVPAHTGPPRRVNEIVQRNQASLLARERSDFGTHYYYHQLQLL